MTGSGADATERAESARKRASELAERLRRLKGGEPVTADDVHRAEQAAERQQERSGEAHRHSAASHSEAAQHHRRVADVLDAAGHADRAAQHRELAAVDDDAARCDVAAARADEVN